jgi:transposase
LIQCFPLILLKESLMGLSYGIDLRERVVAAIEAGLTHRQAGARFCVAVSTAGNWHRLSRKNGSVAPAKQGQPSRSKLDQHEITILGMIEDRKDIALHEIAEQLAKNHGVKAATSTVFQFLAKRGVTFKKRQAMPVSSKDRMCLSAG